MFKRANEWNFKFCIRRERVIDKLLPIGSVFQLTGSPSKVMVIGYYPVDTKTQKMYTYLVTVYPQGVGSKNSMLMCDESSIREVLYKGKLQFRETWKIRWDISYIQHVVAIWVK